MHLFCSTCTLTTCQLHVGENSFTLAIQGQYFSELESSDMARMAPKQSAATRELSVYLDLRNECHPTYLGVTLSYREHLTNTAGKLKNRNNLLTKLAGSTWGRQQQSTAPQSGHALFTQVGSMCTSPMASSALQHLTASLTKEAGGENRQT